MDVTITIKFQFGTNDLRRIGVCEQRNLELEGLGYPPSPYIHANSQPALHKKPVMNPVNINH